LINNLLPNNTEDTSKNQHREPPCIRLLHRDLRENGAIALHIVTIMGAMVGAGERADIRLSDLGSDFDEVFHIYI
jgi:hypothetical protein